LPAIQKGGKQNIAERKVKNKEIKCARIEVLGWF